MHDLIRDMAIQILRERSSIMVKASVQLREIPDMDEWTESLVRVSLMGNQIQEIPSGHSPSCPKLSTLLLRSNWHLRLIADSFFEQLHGLKVLDLSYTRIVKLPYSISAMVRLIALLLGGCDELTYIPSLAKLMQLQKLDLSETGLKNLPEGMKYLSNLRYLNILGSKIKEITVGILPNHSHLQVLIVNKVKDVTTELFRVPKVSVVGKEVAYLRKLESLKCYFEGFSDFRECMQLLSLCTYNIQVGQLNDGDFEELVECDEYSGKEHGIYLNDCCISTEQDFKVFPEDIEELAMWNCRLPGITLFGDSSLSLRCLMKLKVILLHDCNGIKSFVSLPCPSPNFLKCFIIGGCHGVKRVFPIGLMSTLQNLEILGIYNCDRMEEIQATEEDDDEEERHKGEQKSSSSRNLSVEFIRLPKLKALLLLHLPKLKSICSGVMICDSLELLRIVECPKLKRIPLSFPLPSLERIQVYPKEWWETVEWDELTDKDLLRPILGFSGWD